MFFFPWETTLSQNMFLYYFFLKKENDSEYVGIYKIVVSLKSHYICIVRVCKKSIPDIPLRWLFDFFHALVFCAGLIIYLHEKYITELICAVEYWKKIKEWNVFFD